MNTNAITITLFGVTILSIGYDQIEGYLQAGVTAGTTYLASTHKITPEQATAAGLAIAGWVHHFLKADSTGLVTMAMEKIKKTTTPPTTSTPA